jgi:D-glycero-D-manno-heptose 1,7-bisphosphate phosphatase
MRDAPLRWISMPTEHSSRMPGDRAIRWAFLDRDGTLNVKAPDGEYVERPESLELLPGAGEAVRMLNRAGVWTAVVTNQRGVALGRMSAEDLAAVHERLRALLAQQGAALDGIYVCPHEAGSCLCRKPEPGLMLEARREHPDIDFTRAAIVGDSLSDMQAGRRLGLRTVLVGPEKASRPATREADDVAPTLLAAVSLLLT